MADMKGKGIGELAKLVSEMQEELRVIRFGTAGSNDRNVKKRRALRKQIARALTEVSSQRNA